MMNLMEIDGYRAVIQYDPEIEMFRGEFVGLNGGADFYASNIEALKNEAAISLKVFLEGCKERGIEAKKDYSGKFNIRIPPHLHANIASVAAAEGKSLNQWAADVFNRAIGA